MAAEQPSKSRLGICEICNKTDAKYTCPACNTATCSLFCSKKHKKDTDCDGVRVRTSFVKLNDFGNLHLLSDYRLLDDISCKVDSCHRDKLNKNAPLQLHNKFTKLRQAVLARGGDIVTLPNVFIRHRKNTSIFDVRKNQIKWRVQLTFLNAGRLTFYENKCSEETLVSSLIENYVLNSESSFPAAYKKLETYRELGSNSWTVLMKAERVPNSDKKFYKLDLAQSLKENFVGKTIVEYPQLFVLLNGCFTARKPPKDYSSSISFNSNFLLTEDERHKQETVLSSTEESDLAETDSDEVQDEEVKLPSYRDLIQQ